MTLSSSWCHVQKCDGFMLRCSFFFQHVKNLYWAFLLVHHFYFLSWCSCKTWSWHEGQTGRWRVSSLRWPLLSGLIGDKQISCFDGFDVIGRWKDLQGIGRGLCYNTKWESDSWRTCLVCDLAVGGGVGGRAVGTRYRCTSVTCENMWQEVREGAHRSSRVTSSQAASAFGSRGSRRGWGGTGALFAPCASHVTPRRKWHVFFTSSATARQTPSHLISAKHCQLHRPPPTAASIRLPPPEKQGVVEGSPDARMGTSQWEALWCFYYASTLGSLCELAWQ